MWKLIKQSYPNSLFFSFRPPGCHDAVLWGYSTKSWHVIGVLRIILTAECYGNVVIGATKINLQHKTKLGIFVYHRMTQWVNYQMRTTANGSSFNARNSSEIQNEKNVLFNQKVLSKSHPLNAANLNPKSWSRKLILWVESQVRFMDSRSDFFIKNELVQTVMGYLRKAYKY